MKSFVFDYDDHKSYYIQKVINKENRHKDGFHIWLLYYAYHVTARFSKKKTHIHKYLPRCFSFSTGTRPSELVNSFNEVTCTDLSLVIAEKIQFLSVLSNVFFLIYTYLFTIKMNWTNKISLTNVRCIVNIFITSTSGYRYENEKNYRTKLKS